MKIDVFTTNFVPVLGGAEIALYNILGGLREFHDVETELYLPFAGKRAFGQQGIDPGYPVHGLPPKFVALSFKSPSLAAVVFRAYAALVGGSSKPDMAWFNMFFPLADSIRGHLKSRGIPYVIAGRGVDIQKMPEVGYGYRLNPVFEERIRAIAAGAARVIAISEAIRDSYLELGVPAEKISIIPNAIDVDRFEAVEPADLEQLFGIHRGTRVLVTVGRYTPKKGYEYVPEIAARLKARGLDFIWLLVGRGIRDILALTPEVEPHIRFVEAYSDCPPGNWQLPPEELIAVCKAADLFVFPTRIEGLSNVVLEAMAGGLAVVTANVPGCREIVTDGVNGLLVEEGDIAGFADAVDRLLNDHGQCESLAAAGRETVSRYARQRVVGEYRELFRRVVVGSGPEE